jgi:hypothetical protein
LCSTFGNFDFILCPFPAASMIASKFFMSYEFKV